MALSRLPWLAARDELDASAGTDEVDRVQVDFGPCAGAHDQPGGAMACGDPEPGLLEGLDGVGLVAGVDGQVEVVVGSGLPADPGITKEMAHTDDRRRTL